MANKGWKYSRNNLAPLLFWDDNDMEKLKELDIHYKYGVKVNPHKKQPLFFKSNNKGEKPTN